MWTLRCSPGAWDSPAKAGSIPGLLPLILAAGNARPGGAGGVVWGVATEGREPGSFLGPGRVHWPACPLPLHVALSTGMSQGGVHC